MGVFVDKDDASGCSEGIVGGAMMRLLVLPYYHLGLEFLKGADVFELDISTVILTKCGSSDVLLLVAAAQKCRSARRI